VQQRDYILRMIEEMGAALVKLRQMITGGKASPAAVQKELQSAARGLGIDLDTARIASAETLGMMASSAGSPDPSRCWLTAEVLFLDALAAETAGEYAAARAGYDKALRLFSLLQPGAMFLTGWPDAAERVAAIRAKLETICDYGPAL
jgi:hypothetical protein